LGHFVEGQNKHTELEDETSDEDVAVLETLVEEASLKIEVVPEVVVRDDDDEDNLGVTRTEENDG